MRRRATLTPNRCCSRGGRPPPSVPSSSASKAAISRRLLLVGQAGLRVHALVVAGRHLAVLDGVGGLVELVTATARSSSDRFSASRPASTSRRTSHDIGAT